MKPLFIAGLIFFFGSAILLVSNLDIIKLDKYGHIVQMKIEEMPTSCLGSGVQYFVTYRYKDKLYKKATRGSFCEDHYVGELMNMKMLEDSKYILYPDESAYISLISFGILGLFGLILSITQWKKIQKEK